MTDFYKDKDVIIIGGAGFLGSVLVAKLIPLNPKTITVLDIQSQPQFKGNMTLAHEDGITYLNHDITDLPVTSPYCKKGSLVFNLAAAVAGVQYNQNNQLEMFTRNIAIQIAGVQFATQIEATGFLQVSSACVYGDGLMQPAAESYAFLKEPVGANNGYSWAKRMGEKAVEYSSLPHVVIARPFNLYGPNDHYGERAHVIPAMIEKILGPNDAVAFNGTGHEVREFLYVEDCAEALLCLMEKGHHKKAYNIGSNGDTKTSMRALAHLIQSIAGTDKEILFRQSYDSGDSIRYSYCKEIERDTGWCYTTDLLLGLTKTIAQYRVDNRLSCRQCGDCECGK